MFMLKSTHRREVQELKYMHDHQIAALETAIDLLKTSLAKAQKNDSPKDKKTGRFIKK